MKKKTRRPQFAKTLPVSPIVAKTVHIFSEGRRNVIRGIIADARRTKLQHDKIDIVRNNLSETDMVAAATILEAPGGLRRRGSAKLRQSDLFLAHGLTAKSATLEAAYACGYLNAWSGEAMKAIATIALLSQITEVPTKDALGALRKAAEKWGASNYLSRKVTYAKEFLEFDEADQNAADEIDRILGHVQSPMIQYSALENIKERISLFSVARRHTNILRDHVQGDFRRFHSLSNLVPTPISQPDCAGFLLRAVETSLIDTVISIWTVMNLNTRLPDVAATVEQHLSPDILDFLRKAQIELAAAAPPRLLPDCDELSEQVPADDDREERSLSIYRRSAVFLEFPELCLFRNDLDRVIGHRLVAPVTEEITAWHGESFASLDILKRPDGCFDLALHNDSKVQIDTFYRTYLFLRLIQDPASLALLSSDDFQFILDNTMRLETLLLESELKTMHLNGSEDARALISVLALSLYRSKSSDPDIDFDFRSTLEDFIIKNFQGNIAAFIDHLAPKTPEVANYIASSLDEVTLQKMYSIIDSPVAAENARRELLTTVGIHLNKIEYIIEAEAIETRSKVAKLKEYFDASRMFVDSIAMKKWLSSNPSAYTQQYKELLPKLIARLAASKSIKQSDGKETKIDILEITSTDEYLVEQMAKDAFREFCVNNEFGIESYLGRRIRHNTLQGVMTKSVDAVLLRPEYQPFIAGTPFGGALRSWEHSFKIFIERMRKEFLQFRSDSKPAALFSSDVDLKDAATKRNLQQLIHTLRLSGAEMLDELIVSFCWRQIAPQLESASRQIRVKMAQEMTGTLAQGLHRFNGPEEQKIKSALDDGVTSVFAQVASWFQIPQTGFVPASISEICNIIDMEHGRAASTTVVVGDALSTKYYGISVHRLYDCLAVLLQNAFKHGERGSDVVVELSSLPFDGTNLHILDVCVRSRLPADASECVARVDAAVSSTETGRDMVTEGYSGIKKVKFITRLNEGASTVDYRVEDSSMEIRFSLKAEVADEERDD